MEKTLTMGELNRLGNEFVAKWDQYRENILLSAKNLYNLIKLKNKIEEEARVLQQTILEIGTSLGGTITPEGQFQIPPDKVEEMNKKLEDLNDQGITITYDPIMIKDETDLLPLPIMDLLIDFILVAD